MLLDQFSVIVLAVILFLTLLAVILLVWQFQKSQHEFQSEQHKSLQVLTNLLVSKDLATFSGLETMRNDNNLPMDYGMQPLDDVSVSRLMAQRYSDNGMDPNLAFSKTDDDPLADFGGTSALI